MSENRLIDRFGRAHTYLRISVTDRCNLRCLYCMPEEGMAWTPPPQILRFEEITRLARLFVSLGVDKIRLTGGEPLMRGDIAELVRELSSMPKLRNLSMTTNGLALASLAEPLKRNGLHGITVSLDTLRRERFKAIAKRDRFDDAMAGIQAAHKASFAPLKINIVVMQDVNDDEILDFMAWGHDLGAHLRFIEYMPFPHNNWSKAGVVSYARLRAVIEEHYKLLPLLAVHGAVGKDFAVAGTAMRVGFVSSMTDSFCATCNRLRLTADGSLKSCLFHPGEKNLRDVLRDGGDDKEITQMILTALNGKPAAHPPMDELLRMDNRAMIAIGG